MQCGMLPRSGEDLTAVHDLDDPDLLEQVSLVTLGHIYSLIPVARSLGTPPEAIVLSGRLVRRERPVDVGQHISEQCADVAPVLFSEPYASARGAALIARDVAAGADQVLGIPVGEVPAST